MRPESLSRLKAQMKQSEKEAKTLGKYSGDKGSAVGLYGYQGNDREKTEWTGVEML